MKFLVTNDWHTRLTTPENRTDNYLETHLKKLEYLLSFALQNSMTILHGGDFFDNPVAPNELLTAYIQLLTKYNRLILVTPGQHDLYFRSYKSLDKTGLGVLQAAGLVTIVHGNINYNIPCCDCRVSGSGWGEDIPKPLRHNGPQILLVHEHISTKGLFPGMEFIPAASFLKKFKYDLIVCGDVHKKFSVVMNKGTNKARYIVNTGMLCRKATDEIDIVPQFAVYDTETKTLEWHKIPYTRDVFDLTKKKQIKASQFDEQLVNKMLTGLKSAAPMQISFRNNVMSYLKTQKASSELTQVIENLLDEAS